MGEQETLDRKPEENEVDDDLPTEIPPELASVSPGVLKDALDAARLVALRILKSKSKADALVSDVFVKLTTTRRWDPRGGPLDRWMLGVLKSELYRQRVSKASDKEAEAAAGFHREVRPDHVESPEDAMLERADEDRREATATGELEALEAAVRNHPVAPRVLACRRRGVDKAGDIARELGLLPREVYAANDLLQKHLRKIRARDGGGGPDDENDR